MQGRAVPVQQQALHPGALALRRRRRLPGRQRRALRDLLYVCTSLPALNPCLPSRIANQAVPAKQKQSPLSPLCKSFVPYFPAVTMVLSNLTGALIA